VTGSGARAAYSKAFLDHLESPRGRGDLPGATHRGEAVDATCGDRLGLDLEVAGGVVVAARFRAEGCPGALAAGSAIAALLPGRQARLGAVTAAEVEEALGGVPSAKRHALRLATEALRAAVASPVPARSIPRPREESAMAKKAATEAKPAAGKAAPATAKKAAAASAKRHRIVLLLGDGTGPELAETTRRVLDATGVAIDWVEAEAGVDVHAKEGTPLPARTLDAIRAAGIAIKAPVTTPVGTGFRSVNVALRKEFDLYACLRPCKSYPGVRSRYEDIDLVIVRENTEDLYAGIEFEKGTPENERVRKVIEEASKRTIRPDSGISIKPISVAGTERIHRYAFEYARKHGRKKVTTVHKANIMKHTDGLWLAVAREVAKSYPDVEFEDRIVDNMCMQLVQKPELYDVLVLPNLYGDIVSDLCAGLVGGLGVAPGGNIGEKMAIFEATHGSAPKYKGLDKVNPTAMVLSGMLMLEHIGEVDAARRLEAAVAKVIREGKRVTYDMKADRDDPTAVGTRAMGDAIAAALA
jgi:isocitrate dehydrogenase (NAD+)